MSPILRRAGLAVTAAVGLLLGACAGEPPDDGRSITVWTADTLPDRVAATQAIIERFTAATGVAVELVGVDDDQFNQLLTSAAASGELPDVMGGLSLASLRTLGANDLVDTASTAAVLDALDPATFDARALELTREGPDQLAIPSETWSQLLYYRRDLFEAAGLAPPATYDDILAAAQVLDTGGRVGFAGATAAGDAFTQQTFEHLALANGCELVDAAGEILLESPPCVAAFEFYRRLIADHSVPGAQDVDTVRASYFSGQAAMAIWSTYLLDELAGLRDDALPTCPECVADPTFLARNTGVVTALQGPDGRAPVQYGEVVSWTIPVEASAEPARRFVEFMLGEGYVDWLAFAPEGKFPARVGATPGSREYVDVWPTLPAGVDRREPLDRYYPPEVLDLIQTGPGAFARWGITQGQGALIGASLGELPVPEAVAALTGGGTDAAGAARQASETLREIEESLR